MKCTKELPGTLIDIDGLENLKIEFINSEYIVTLMDKPDIEILKGYGTTITDAMNSLHSNLI